MFKVAKVYLSGFWIIIKYMTSAAEVFVKHFTPKSRIHETGVQGLAQKNKNSVSWSKVLNRLAEDF